MLFSISSINIYIGILWLWQISTVEVEEKMCVLFLHHLIVRTLKIRRSIRVQKKNFFYLKFNLLFAYEFVPDRKASVFVKFSPFKRHHSPQNKRIIETLLGKVIPVNFYYHF